MARLTFAAFLVLSGWLPTAVHAAEEDQQIWIAPQATIAVGKRLSVTADMQFRFTDHAARFGQLVVRQAVGYRFDHTTTAYLGYAYARTDPLTGATTHEHRVFQQLNTTLAGKAGAARITGRTRIEQRFVEGFGGNVGWRLRQNVRGELPVGRGVSLVSWVEPFVAVNATRWGQRGGLEQVRGFAGVNVPVAHGLSIEPGYLGQYLVRKGRPDRLNHIFSLSLSLRR